MQRFVQRFLDRIVANKSVPEDVTTPKDGPQTNNLDRPHLAALHPTSPFVKWESPQVFDPLICQSFERTFKLNAGCGSTG